MFSLQLVSSQWSLSLGSPFGGCTLQTFNFSDGGRIILSVRTLRGCIWRHHTLQTCWGHSVQVDIQWTRLWLRKPHCLRCYRLSLDYRLRHHSLGWSYMWQRSVGGLWPQSLLVLSAQVLVKISCQLGMKFPDILVVNSLSEDPEQVASSSMLLLVHLRTWFQGGRHDGQGGLRRSLLPLALLEALLLNWTVWVIHWSETSGTAWGTPCACPVVC